MNKAEIAKTLEDSGLFHSVHKTCWGKGGFNVKAAFGGDAPEWLECQGCEGTGKVFDGIPTADQSEKTLSDLGLQVVWDFDEDEVEHECFLIGLNFISIKPPNVKLDGLFQAECFMAQFIGRFKGGERTLANNAAMARLAKQPEWLERLKISIDKTTQP